MMYAKTYLSALAVSAALTVAGFDTASAATYTISPGSVSVTGVDFCAPGDCTLSGVITGGSFDLNNTGDTAHLSSLFDWSILTTSKWATGAGIYSVSATLNFTSPSAETASGSGTAGFATLLGVISGGFLKWSTGSGLVDFDDGSQVAFSFDNAKVLGFGTEASTGAKFTMTAPAAVPLPAAGLALVAGLGMLAAARRRKA